MILGNDEIRKFYFGAYSFEETADGYLRAYQYTTEQMAYFKTTGDFWYDRCMASTAKTLEFITDATEISFDYKIIWKGSEDTFEATTDGLITQIFYLKDIPDEGRLAFTFAEGDKNAMIYLPADATVLIKDLKLNGKADIPHKNEKVLWLGDSITQGYGPLRSACTYVSVANRILNYDLINQGIGGYIYDKKSLMKMDGYTPDKIIVALGTNQFGDKTMDAVEEYYERLTEIYGITIPILTITPLWRGDVKNGEPDLIRYCQGIKDVCSQYENIRVVDGFKLIPHLPEYFLDNLHPNVIGAELYGRGLADRIRETGF